MKINKLKFAAFGPFSGTVDIDFDKLNKNGLFLLTGPTGVGKTSIFDAISFAIYGETTGNSDSFSKVVSDYKKDTELCYVDIEFVVSGEVIKIHREPTQPYFTRKRLTERKHTVSCTIKDKVYSKVPEVKSLMEEYIGLGLDQFKQIVMIPQGEFVKFLQSNSKEKMDIFRKLFNTLNASKIEDKLRESSTILRKEINDTETGLNTLFDSFGQDIKSAEFIANSNKEEKILFVKSYLDTLSEKIKALEINKAEFTKKENTLRDKIEEYEKFNIFVNKYNGLKEGLTELEKNSASILELEENVKKINKSLEIEKVNSELIKESSSLEKLKENLKETTSSLSALKLELENLKKEEYKVSLYKKENESLISLKTKLAIELENIDKELELKKKEKESRDKISKDNVVLAKKKEFTQNKENSLISRDSITDKINSLKDSLSEIKIKGLETKQEILSTESNIEKAREKNELNLEINNIKHDLLNEDKIKLEINSGILLIDEETANNDIYKVLVKTQIGDVCPICGNKVLHLNEASYVDIDINKKGELDKLLKKQDEKILKLQKLLASKEALSFNINLDSTCLELNQKLKALTNNREELLNSYSKKDDALNKELKILEDNDLLIKEIDILKEEQKQIESNLDLNTKNLNLIKNSLSSLGVLREKSEVCKLLEDTNNKFVNNNNFLTSFANSFNTITNNIARQESQIESINLNIKTKTFNVDELSEVFKTLSSSLPEFREYLELKDNLNDYQIKIKDFNENMFYFKSSLSEIEIYKDKELKDTLTPKTKLTEVKEELNNLISEISSLSEGYRRDSTTLSKTRKLYSTSKNKLKEHDKLNNLNNLICGKNKEKVDFERYIILSYYDDILREANKLLKVMTKNRYSLYRRSDYSGNGVKGLDLDISDSNTGKRRDVKTLSGGESFMTALSLALGLAEVIKQTSGGSNLETLFIDEGFGTLSSENLDSALNILADIKKRGYTVGVISHVEAIKERINCKVILNRDNKGSFIEKIIS